MRESQAESVKIEKEEWPGKRPDQSPSFLRMIVNLFAPSSCSPSVGTSLVFRFLFAVLLVCTAMSGSATAQIVVPVSNADGAVVFELRFFNPSDGPFCEGYDGPTSSRVFTAAEINAIAQAAQYWVDVLKPNGQMPVVIDKDGNPVLDAAGNEQPQSAIINVGTISVNNAWGDALTPISSETNNPYSVNMSTALIADGSYVTPTYYDGHGVLALGTGFNTAAPSQVGLVEGNITTVAIHEFGHILGIVSPMEVERYTGVHLTNGDFTAIYKFPQELTRWQSNLRDNNGNSAVPGNYANVPGKPVDDDPTDGGKYIFDMGDPNSLIQPANFTFTGANALEVYYDGNEQLIREKTAVGQGVPLQGLVLNQYSYLNDPNFVNVENPGGANDRWVYQNPNTMSHIDVHNSTMSWQMYRNYPMFLEVELGAMQDLGYDIERRNFFGRSFYVDGTTAINDTPFWNWGENEWGEKGYQVGTPNTSTYGIGLHLFADDLNILQRGIIRADGPGAAGIRIDGVNNTLTVGQGTTVTAYGTNGIGLLVAYGKEHHIIHQGTITTWDPTKDQWTNQRGTAVQFNFGEPMVGARLGSYAFDSYFGYMNEGNIDSITGSPVGGYPEELQGPLVKAFDVTGTIIGGTMGHGAPTITPGRDDRIISRDLWSSYWWSSYLHRDSLDYYDIIRLFENGTLAIPEIQSYSQTEGEPMIDIYRSAIIINPDDGSIILCEGNLVYVYVSDTPEDLPEDLPTDAVVDMSNGYYNQFTVKYADSDYTVYDYGSSNYTIITHEGKDRIVIDPTGTIRATGYIIIGPDSILRQSNPDGTSYPYYSYSYLYDITVVFRNNDGKDNVDINHYPWDNQYLIDNYDTDYAGNYIGDHAYVRVRDPNWGLGDSYSADQAFIREYILQGTLLPDNLVAHLLRSYITPEQDTVDFMPIGGSAIFIAGPLPDSTTGYLQGGSHVDTINIMQGAKIEGDIISHYNSRDQRRDLYGGVTIPLDPALQTRFHQGLGTTLTFGLKPGADGAATSAADPDFHFVFKDNINYYETIKRAYVNGRPGEEDILRWGYYNYDPELGGYDQSLYSVGNYVYAGPGQGRYNLTDSWEVAGKIDLRFAGGYTEFRPNDENTLKTSRSFVNSVLIDAGATFSLGADYRINPETGKETKIATSLYVMYDELLADSGCFENNGRFSGEGTVMVGAQKERQTYVIAPLYDGTIAYIPLNGETAASIPLGANATSTVLPMAYYSANGTLVNRGTIAPGPNDGYGEPDRYVGTQFVVGRKTGTLAIGGNLDMGSTNSVYEVTITDGRETTVPTWIETNDGIELVESEVNPSGWGNGDSDRLVVSGVTTLGGTLKIHVTPGNYSPDPTVYTIIHSEGGYTSGTNFENFEYYLGFMTFEPYNLNAINTYVSPTDARDLQFTVVRDPDFFKRLAGTYNEAAVAAAVDNSFNDSYLIAFTLGDRRLAPADVRDMYNQMGAHIRANSALMNLWNPSQTLFNRIGYGNGQMETGNRGRVNWQRIQGKTSKMLGQQPTRSHRVGSLWVDTLYNSFSAEADYNGNSSDYRFSRTGAMVGAEMNLTRYASLGGIMSFHVGNTRQMADKVDSNDYVLGAYFVCAPFNEFEFKAFMGFGFQDYKMERNVYNAAVMSANSYIDSKDWGPARYKSDFVGNSFNVSFELARPLELHRTFILRPTLGVDTQYLWQNGATESAAMGTSAYALSFQKMTFYRSLFRAGFSSETSGARGSIRMRAFYVAQFDGDNFPGSNASFASGGQVFNVHGVDLGGEFLNLGIGANLWFDGEKTASLFFDYDSEIYGTKKKTLSHTVQFGYLQTF